MECRTTLLNGVLLLTPTVFGDERGSFTELYSRELFGQLGIDCEFVQDNVSISDCGVFRGLHFQDPPQDKLVWVAKGAVFDVVVNIQTGEYITAYLSGDNKKLLFIPKGYAHGFLALTDNTIFCYKCSDYYNPDGQKGIIWNDRDIGIRFPLSPSIISDKDKALPTLKMLREKT